jgi:hypothetical protein
MRTVHDSFSFLCPIKSIPIAIVAKSSLTSALTVAYRVGNFPKHARNNPDSGFLQGIIP